MSNPFSIIMDSYIVAILPEGVEVYNFAIDVDTVNPGDLIRFHDRAASHIKKRHPECLMCQVMNYDSFLDLKYKGVLIHLDPQDFAPDLILRDNLIQ